jgi:murein DD-endopeptidase MepM/ murein hydrolase activator NlpD
MSAPLALALALAASPAQAQPPAATPASPAPPTSSAPAAPPAKAPAAAPAPAPAPFAFGPPGNGNANDHKGWVDATVFVPNMRFPIDHPPAYANSQVWRSGGDKGLPKNGPQCTAQNYAYPWEDNFCEARGRGNPLCTGGTGHQGQDIRPNACIKAQTVAVAAEAGRITQIASFTVYLTADDGRVFRYLHMQMDKLMVKRGQRVERGQPIGLVSNVFYDNKGTLTPTTIHLHFEVIEPITSRGKAMRTYAPPYTSLVDAYQRLLAGQP